MLNKISFTRFTVKYLKYDVNDTSFYFLRHVTAQRTLNQFNSGTRYFCFKPPPQCDFITHYIHINYFVFFNPPQIVKSQT